MPSKRKILLLAIPLSALVIAGAAYGYERYRNASDQSELAQARNSAYAALVASQGPLPNPRTPPAGQEEYHNLTYGFSLFYPADLSLATEYSDGNPGGVTLVFQDTAAGKGFQVYITPYAESQISQVEFLADDPAGVMDDPTAITIDGVKATMFFSYDQTLGDTREVWFIRGGYLFELTTYEADDQWLAGIMSTWLWLPTSPTSAASATIQ